MLRPDADARDSASLRKAPTLVLLLLVLLGITSARRVSADAAPESPRVSAAPSSRTCRLCGDHGWELELALPLWIPNVSGSLATGRAEGDSDFGKNLTIDSSFRYVMMAKLSMRVHAWGAQVDTFAASLTGAIGFTFSEGDVGHLDLSGGLLRMAASYRVPALELGRSDNPLLLSLAPYAGTRRYRIDESYTGQRIDQDVRTKWWDPIVGLSAHLDFRMGLVLHAECDVGGFGLGNQLAWWFASSLEYGFLDWFAASVGWTFARFEQDSERAGLDLTLSMSGPQLTLSFYMQ